jgi:hypothetical protein
MSTPQISNEILDYFKAMVDVNRLRIAGMLGLTRLTAAQIVDRLNLPLREVVNHLGFLVFLGVVRQDGEFYQLDEAAIEALARRALSGARKTIKEEDLPEDEYDRKVIKDFSLPDGSFKSLPMQQKKFGAIIRHVVNVFEPGTQYTEKQVNELLRKYNEDTASLRRGLVDSGLMQRQAGAYWRK